ncbi:fructose-specific PTS transporter subunit EIIC [Ruminococcus sp.]|uniref:PTS fructose transporter subunit IIABC n=1 Tax=Ruminococcus sp. TaxID=41978 RepID=UPI0025D6DA7E|nr:fructose-specific PTS transporter subunit EIIC [Ruminococcus sp.]MCI6616766.1 fructose-specific PTS transporter subunit EIIC [Ruminococcus sp.]
MRITDLLKKNGIALNVNVSDKSTAIDKLVSLHEKCGNLKNTAAFKEGILKREEMGTTAVGMEVAIPHAKSDAVKAPALTAITVPNGVDYGAADKKPCKLIFMIAATTDGDVHLEVLARLMQLLMDEEFTAKLKKAKTADEFLSIIDRKETEKFPDEAKAPAKPAKKGYRVLAVTACPTGIAHTYMAAEALVKAGEKMGITVKVETNGSGGAKNVLTAEEIANCDGIIIAADKSVETARFDGKPVYSTKVSDGINKPEELIKKIVNGQAPVFHSDRKAKAEVSGGGNESIGRQLYKHLMNGVSHMLPFVVAGGIFIAIAFLIDAASGVQAAGNSAFGTVNPVAAWFKNIGGYAFNFMIPILAGFIARSIADRPGLLVGFVGGFLATNGATFVDPGAAATIPSGFLGALLAGFAGGYLMLALEKLCDKLPNALEGIKPVLLYPLAGLGIVAVMMCAVNPIMGIVNTGLNSGLIWLYENNLGILLACILGAMMSIDMGGPFNKAAYVFGTGMLTTAATNPEVATVAYQIMACVMIGGMVPPLAIALSTTFFKSRWTAEERKNGVVNYVMGLSFITEGAIPYAASSPLKVIPSCAIGSAVAGGLSWLFGCTLMAPHGGIFVVATIGNPLLYLLALAIGAVVGMILLTIMKRPIDTAKKK